MISAICFTFIFAENCVYDSTWDTYLKVQETWTDSNLDLELSIIVNIF